MSGQEALGHAINGPGSQTVRWPVRRATVIDSSCTLTLGQSERVTYGNEKD